MFKHTILILSTFYFFSATLHSENVAFLKDNLKLALKKANKEGKLIFVDFYAGYCTPCKIMDEHTFTQPEVNNKLSASYVPLKVDIESFDGYDLKNQYQVTVLPTLLILDSKGKLIARYEESMGGAALIKILDKYNLPEYKTRKNVSAIAYNKQTLFSNSAPFVSLGSMKPSSENAVYKIGDEPKIEPTNTKKQKPVKSYEQPETATEDFVERKQNNRYESPAAAKPEKPIKNLVQTPKPQRTNSTFTASIKNNIATSLPIKSHVNITPIKTNQTLAIASEPQLKKISNVTDGYTIKTGAFSNDANAQKAADAVKLKLGSNSVRIIVQKKIINAETKNRVLVGKFASNEEATAFKNKFKIDGVVMSFQQLK